MAWHEGMKRAEQTIRMEQIASVVRRFEEAAISAPTAIEKIRELLEPLVVRVGEGNTPEVQS